jgi:pimeloyl-ACP methyl ester carboxylesterase
VLGARDRAARRTSTRIEDVLNHIAYEGLKDVVLVAHSYAGFVAYGVAERNAAAIGRLVLLDAFIPGEGETMADHVGERGDQYLQPLTVGPGMEWIAEKLYISCTCPALPILDVSKRRIAEAGWPITELACGHDAMIAAPGELADILLG